MKKKEKRRRSPRRARRKQPKATRRREHYRVSFADLPRLIFPLVSRLFELSREDRDHTREHA